MYSFDRLNWCKRIKLNYQCFTNTSYTPHLVVVSKATKSLQETSEAVHPKLCPPGMLCSLCLTAGSCHPLVVPRTDAPASCPCPCPCLVCLPCPVSILPLCPEEPRHSVNSPDLSSPSITRQRKRHHDSIKTVLVSCFLVARCSRPSVFPTHSVIQSTFSVTWIPQEAGQRGNMDIFMFRLQRTLARSGRITLQQAAINRKRPLNIYLKNKKKQLGIKTMSFLGLSTVNLINQFRHSMTCWLEQFISCTYCY